MKKLFLNLYTFLIITSSLNIFPNELEIKNDEPIYIKTSDGNTLPIEYKLLKQSLTVLNMIEHTITSQDALKNNQETEPITIKNLTKKDWDELITLLKQYTRGYKVNYLESKTIDDLAHIINNANYLQISSILEPAIEVIAYKIQNSSEYICNENTINKISKDGEEICKNALKINIPFVIEQQIVKQIIPLHINKLITIMEAQIFLKRNRNEKLTKDEEIIYENIMKK